MEQIRIRYNHMDACALRVNEFAHTIHNTYRMQFIRGEVGEMSRPPTVYCSGIENPIWRGVY